jgi:hypothetical protein
MITRIRNINIMSRIIDRNPTTTRDGSAMCFLQNGGYKFYLPSCATPFRNRLFKTVIPSSKSRQSS